MMPKPPAVYDGSCGRPTVAGEQCKNPEGWKTPHPGKGPCAFHGGFLPQVVRKYQREEAQEILTKLGEPIEVDPVEALLMALYEAHGHASWLRGQLEELSGESPEQLQLYSAILSSAGTKTYKTGEAKPHVLWVMWCEERDRAAKLAAACIKAGIAERQVKLAEQQAVMVIELIRTVLDDPELALTQEQRAAADKVVPLRLRAVGEGSSAYRQS